VNKFARPLEWNEASAEPAGSRPAPPPHHYFAFLSYSHKDSEEADWLHTELERFKVPSSLAGRLTATGVIPKRLTPIFRDRSELAAGHDLTAEIRQTLAHSRCLVVLCSPAAATSKWTNAEIEAFKHSHPDGCIIAAIVGGEPFASEMPGREAEECFPDALRQKFDRRGRPTGRRAEPLAADLRESGDGRRRGFLKIVAGILGVGLDDLVQRDHLRRQRRLAFISAGSLAGMIIAIFLAVTAIQARDAARDQRRQAERLVEFMLGDLKDKLDPIGRLDVLDGVGWRVLQYYQQQDRSQLSDAALLQRSKALSLMAQVAYERGKTDDAESLYREAMAGTAEAVQRSPDDPERLFEHAQNVFWIGEIARDRGQYGPAEAAYREYKRLADRMVAIEPDNLRWRMEVAYANENLGIALFNERRFAEATQRFQSGINPLESAAGIDSTNGTYRAELANLLGWLAESHRAEGHLQTAIEIRQRQVDFLDRLIGPGAVIDVRLREKQIPAHEALGHLFASTGKTDQSIEQFRMAATIADRLRTLEPTNSIWRRYAAATRLDLARELAGTGRTQEAAPVANSGCAIANLGKWGKLNYGCYAVRSRIALASGSTADATALANRALQTARAGTGDRIDDPFLVAQAYRLIGDIAARGGDSARATEAWNAGLASIPSNAAERPWEIHEHEQLLRRLGRIDQALPLTKKLAAMGYRSVN